MAEDKKDAKTERFVVGEVPTQYGPAIIDTESKTAFTIETALAKIMNDTQELKKLLN